MSKSNICWLFLAVLAIPAVCAASNAIEPVPEPSSALLLLAGGVGAAVLGKIRGRR